MSIRWRPRSSFRATSTAAPPDPQHPTTTDRHDQPASRFFRPAALHRRASRACRPGHRPPARRGPRRRGAPGHRGRAARLGELRRAPGRRQRASRARLGAGVPPELRGEHARAARGLQRGPAEDHRALHRPGPGPAALRPLPRARGFPRLRRAPAGAPAACPQRTARLPPRRRGAPGRAEGPLQAAAGGARGPLGALPGQRARRDQRLLPRRDRGGERRGHPVRRPGGRARWPGATAGRAGSSRCTRRATCR